MKVTNIGILTKMIFYISIFIIQDKNLNAIEISKGHFDLYVNKESQYENGLIKQNYLKLKGREVLLPIHTLTLNNVSNTSNTLWALNYHETSNYNGFDLVVDNKDRVYIIGNVYTIIESKLYEMKILPSTHYYNYNISVKSINMNVLVCHFHGSGGQQKDFSADFQVKVTFDKNKICLEPVSFPSKTAGGDDTGKNVPVPNIKTGREL